MRARPVDPDPKPDLTPMIDIVFNLIIFFLIVSELSNLTIEELSLAAADQAAERPVELCETVHVNVLADGQVKVGGERFGVEPGDGHQPLRDLLDLEASLQPRADDGSSPLAVDVRADRDVPFGRVQGVLDACQRAELHKTRFAADPGEESREPRRPSRGWRGRRR